MERFSQLSARQVKSIPSLHVDQCIMAIEAARHGQGAVLCSALLTELEVREGTLYEPFADRLDLSKAYFVIHHKNVPLRPAALVLKKWLLTLSLGL